MKPRNAAKVVPKRGWAFDLKLKKAVLAYRFDVEQIGWVIVAAKDGRVLNKSWNVRLG